MLDTLRPYPIEKLELKITPRPDWRYTICIALRDVYQNTTDPELKKRIQYVATIAEALSNRLYQIDTQWFMAMFPTVEEYNKLMEDSNVRD